MRVITIYYKVFNKGIIIYLCEIIYWLIYFYVVTVLSTTFY